MTTTDQNLISTGRLTVDLNAYADNWRFLNDKTANAECGAMVKADAYGIQIDKAVGALEAAGCKTFFVATPTEGVAVRAQSKTATIYILNGLMAGAAGFYHQHNLRPVLNTMDEVNEWAAEQKPAALHVDTGMNRLGLREEEATILAEDQALVSKLNLSLMMTHLACGDSPRSLMNGCQLSSFLDICALYPDVPRSLCNSAGIFHGQAFHLDMVRPGIALYGGAGLNEHVGKNPMKPVVKVEARILQIRDLLEHESVGYSAAETATSDRKIATISAGYADGYLRQSGSTSKEKGASAYLHDKRVPLMGRVSMDLIAIDITDVPEAKRGDYVELFGPNVSVSEVATHAQSIDYELLTGLGKRYTRHYGALD